MQLQGFLLQRKSSPTSEIHSRFELISRDRLSYFVPHLSAEGLRPQTIYPYTSSHHPAQSFGFSPQMINSVTVLENLLIVLIKLIWKNDFSSLFTLYMIFYL